MINYIQASAKAVGIVAFFLNSSDKIEAQLNRINRDEDNPVMLISWDIDTRLNFDSNGFLENPYSNITSLLVIKPNSTADDDAQEAVDQMASLFENFITDLYNRLNTITKKTGGAPLSNIEYKRVPVHGAGKHSGVLGKWTMRTPNTVCNG